jgi:general secretion pathway protein B
LAGLRVINAAVLLVLLMRSSAPPATHARAAGNDEPQPREARPHDLPAGSAPAPAPAPPAQDRDHFSPLDNAPVYAPEIPVPEGTAPAVPAPAAAAPTPRADVPARTTHRADPVLNDEPSDDNEMLPSITELNLTGNQSLPEIHLDVHVYATRSADRFVYINMRKYREGAVLQEGPTLERIRRDGVVLNYNGLRFFVPRQS